MLDSRISTMSKNKMALKNLPVSTHVKLLLWTYTPDIPTLEAKSLPINPTSWSSPWRHQAFGRSSAEQFSRQLCCVKVWQSALCVPVTPLEIHIVQMNNLAGRNVSILCLRCCEWWDGLFWSLDLFLHPEVCYINRVPPDLSRPGSESWVWPSTWDMEAEDWKQIQDEPEVQSDTLSKQTTECLLQMVAGNP